MNNKLILLAALVITFTACNRRELADSKNTNDSLEMVINERDQALNEFITSFNEVEKNLDSVAMKQHIITISVDHPGEFTKSRTTRINDEIAAINKLMDENRKSISALKTKLKNSIHKNAVLEKTLATLSDQLNQKNLELEYLNTQLNSLNAQVTQLETSVSSLTAVNKDQSDLIESETAALHSAYYVIGNTKELQDVNIIDRQGGLLGIGKTSMLRSDFDNTMFTHIDYTQSTLIGVNSKMKIITSHPSDSYTLQKDTKDKNLVTSILISNPEKFWSASKYLVIIKN